MDAFDAVRTVLAVRQYKADAIPDDVLHRIVEAGHLTGSFSADRCAALPVRGGGTCT